MNKVQRQFFSSNIKIFLLNIADIKKIRKTSDNTWPEP